MTMILDGTSGVTLPTQFDSASTFGFKNRFINGAMQIAQRATSGTSGSSVPTTSPAIYPSIDRWYAYATGATVTVAQVAGTVPIKNNLAVTGAASVTTVGVGQRIEQLNSYDLAGSTATLSVNISNTLLTTVTWTASYATTADTWTTKTQIATGTFTVTSTLTKYSANISIPSAATTGIEILFTVGAQTSGTWTIGNAQLEQGSTATSFDYRSFGAEFQLCQRYYELFGHGGAGKAGSGNVNAEMAFTFQVTKRALPSILFVGSALNQVLTESGVGTRFVSSIAGTSVGVNGTYVNSQTTVNGSGGVIISFPNSIAPWLSANSEL